MAKHRVKVQYVTEIETETQMKALELAIQDVPDMTTNVHIECWTPKPTEKSEVSEEKFESSVAKAA